MPSTRSTTGSSRPRIHASIDTGPERKRKTTTTTGAKRGRPTGKSLTGAGVKKRGRPSGNTTTTSTTAAHHKRKSHVGDKIEGVADKVIGSVARKPGKKAAGTKKIRGTDGKNARGRPKKI